METQNNEWNDIIKGMSKPVKKKPSTKTITFTEEELNLILVYCGWAEDSCVQRLDDTREAGMVKIIKKEFKTIEKIQNKIKK